MAVHIAYQSTNCIADTVLPIEHTVMLQAAPAPVLLSHCDDRTAPSNENARMTGQQTACMMW
jgi:hypothetical protein